MESEFKDVLMEFIENEKRLGKEVNVDKFICELVDANKMNDTKLRHVLCSVEDLLKNYNQWQVKFGKRIFQKLISLLKKDQGIPANLAIYILKCTKQYVDQFPQKPSQDLCQELWALSMNIEYQPHAPVILRQFFELFVQHIDNFLYQLQLQHVIKQLLNSPEKMQRNTGIYLMGLQTAAIEKSEDERVEVDLKAIGWKDKQTYVHCLSTYMNIWKQVDGEVTPSIENLDDLLHLMRISSYSWRRTWLEFLFVRLLSQDNLNIIHMTIEFLMSLYNFGDLSLRMRNLFRMATNNVLLFDVNGQFLNRTHIPLFLNSSRVEFLEAFISIDSWNFVPTHFWFSYFRNEDISPTISYNLLMRIAKCVRRQSYEIRGVMQSLFLRNIFQITIKLLSIPEYIAYMEALYDVDDAFDQTYQFIELLYTNADTDLSPFSKRFYEILTNRFNNYQSDRYTSCTGSYFNDMLEDVCNRLKFVPKEQHAWLRFFIVFDFEQTNFLVDFCRQCYDLDLTKLTDHLSLTEFHQMIADKLVWNPDEEADFIHSKCVDLYTEFQLHSWSDMRNLSLDPLELISMGNSHTFTRLLKLLGEHDAPDVPQHVLDGLLQTLHEKYLERKFICELYMRHMSKYADKHLSESVWDNLLCKILNCDLEHRILSYQVIWRMKMSKEFLIRGLLHGEPSRGVKRVEEAYEELNLQTIPVNMALRHNFHLKKQLHLNTSIIDDLLDINNELSIRIPEYHEQSKVHCLKIRIAQAIFSIQHLYKWQYWSEELWTALLADYNVRNIRYLYELMIIKFAVNVEQILVKIRKIAEFSGANKLSLLSVVYNYYMINSTTVKDHHLIEITELITPLTMGNNCLVREYAQLIVYVLVKEIDSKRIKKPDEYDEFQRNARLSLGDERLVELLLQPRFKMHEYYKESPVCANAMLLYVTNTPIDECAHWIMRTGFDDYFQKQFDEARSTYIRDLLTRPRTYIAASDDLNLNFGPYAINPKPVKEIIYKTIENEKSEMLVVASLIDNLPNLIGIISTCDLLGVRDIFISSARLLENIPFSALRIKSILHFYEVTHDNLVGYLIMKKIEGYKIVGADETVNNVSFKDFKFPAMCILLFGHEKHGIPADLISVLDHIVEIPKLGGVRFLNVQLTGALFMLEYCRQHASSSKVKPEFISNFEKRDLNWRRLRAPYIM